MTEYKSNKLLNSKTRNASKLGHLYYFANNEFEIEKDFEKIKNNEISAMPLCQILKDKNCKHPFLTVKNGKLKGFKFIYPADINFFDYWKDVKTDRPKENQQILGFYDTKVQYIRIYNYNIKKNQKFPLLYWIPYVNKQDIGSLNIVKTSIQIKQEKEDKEKTENKRKKVYNMFDGHCAYCGKKITIDEMTIDHCKPKSKKGSNDLFNLYPSCKECNGQKGSKTISEYRNYLSLLPVSLLDNIDYAQAIKFELIKQAPHPVQFYFEKKK